MNLCRRASIEDRLPPKIRPTIAKPDTWRSRMLVNVSESHGYPLTDMIACLFSGQDRRKGI
jgi:hypothetical protein